MNANLASKFPTATITSTETLTTSYLNTIKVLVIGDATGSNTATTPLSAAEQTALFNFVASGGSAIITVDNDTFQSGVSTINNSYISVFGLHDTGTLIGGQLATATTSVGPIMNGVFGLVTTIGTNFPGYFDNLGSSATSLANLNSNNQPVIAWIAPGTLNAGSGGVLFASDTILADGIFNQSSNTTLFNNTIAAFTSSPVVPEPSSSMILGLGIVTLLVSRRLRRLSGPHN